MKPKKLYYKNDKGRYEEYKEPTTDNALYRKVNGKYEAVNMQLAADSLEEGVWVVRKSRYSRSMTSGDYIRRLFTAEKVGDIQRVSIAKLGGMLDLAEYLAKRMPDPTQQWGKSRHDYACEIVRIIFDYDGDKSEF